MRKTAISLFIPLILLAQGLHAQNARLNEAVVQIINQLSAISPLIDEAERAQHKNARIKLHLHAFKGRDGKIHNGLKEDITEIKQGLIAFLNKPAIEPKKIEPLKGDFLDVQIKEASNDF